MNNWFHMAIDKYVTIQHTHQKSESFILGK